MSVNALTQAKETAANVLGHASCVLPAPKMMLK